MEFISWFCLFQASFCLNNLVWGGNFQYFDGPFIFANMQKFIIIPSNLSNWYSPTLEKVQIKEIFRPLTTQAAELSAQRPITLCQKIFLQPGATYKLSYEIYTQQKLCQMMTIAYLNGEVISQIYTQNNDQFERNTKIFTAQKELNQLCFNESHSVVNISLYGNLEGLGGLLDNITLYQIKKYSVLFESSVDEIGHKIIIDSNLPEGSEPAEQFKIRYILSLSYIQMTFQYVKSEKGFLQIILSPQQSINLENINFVENPQNIGNWPDLIIFDVTVTNRQQYFYSLTDRQKYLINSAKPIALNIAKVIGTILLLSKSFFCCYFIMSLIAFENLSIFYIFLKNEIFPHFSRQIYHETLRIFQESSSMTFWIQKQLSLETNPFQIIQQTEKIPQAVPKNEGVLAWLGDFGFSSLVWNSNCQGFVLMGFLTLKILLLKIASKFIRLSILGISIKKRDVLAIFLVQFANMVVGLTISALYQIRTSTQNFYVKIEKSLQVIIYFSCFVTISIYRFQVYVSIPTQKKHSKSLVQKILKEKMKGQINIQQYHSNLTKEKEQSMLKQKRKNLTPQIVQQSSKSFEGIRKRRYNSISNMLLNCIISSLTVVHSTPLFLTIGSLLLIFKAFEERLHLSAEGNMKMAVGFLINFVWIIHHCVFISLSIFNRIIEQENEHLQKFSQLVINLGIFAILTLIVGSVLEIVKFVIEVLGGFIFLIKLLIQRARKDPKILPMDFKVIKKDKKKKIIMMKKQKKQQKILQQNKNINQEKHKTTKENATNQLHRGSKMKIKKQKKEKILVRLRTKNL